MIIASGAFQAGQLFGVAILILIVVGVVRELVKRRGDETAASVGREPESGREALPPQPSSADQPEVDSPAAHRYDAPEGPRI